MITYVTLTSFVKLLRQVRIPLYISNTITGMVSGDKPFPSV